MTNLPPIYPFSLKAECNLVHFSTIHVLKHGGNIQDSVERSHQDDLKRE